jgi:hypothetical protein
LSLLSLQTRFARQGSSLLEADTPSPLYQVRDVLAVRVVLEPVAGLEAELAASVGAGGRREMSREEAEAVLCYGAYRQVRRQGRQKGGSTVQAVESVKGGHRGQRGKGLMRHGCRCPRPHPPATPPPPPSLLARPPAGAPKPAPLFNPCRSPAPLPTLPPNPCCCGCCARSSAR